MQTLNLLDKHPTTVPSCAKWQGTVARKTVAQEPVEGVTFTACTKKSKQAEAFRLTLEFCRSRCFVLSYSFLEDFV